MICAACGEPTEGAPCGECGASPLLDGRYRLEAALGSGSSGTTWRGSTIVDGQALAPVAIKELRVANLDSTKARELVEREIRVLREVQHPAIPRYWEDLFVGKGRSKTIYIVQDFVDGQTLAEESRHRRYTEYDVFDIIAELLHILRYLHALRPPIVHRDIKPANVIRRIDGRLALIDFGSVRDCVKGDLGGSTVAGTFGYMAPEQFRGDAWPVTDLYGVGALATALLSRREPQTMLDWSGRLKWEEATTATTAMTAILRRLLAPDPMERFPSADDALAEVGRARRPKSATSGPSLRPMAAPRALKASLERIALAQPGTSATLSDAQFALAPATDWGRDHLPAPLIRWTSALPRREEPPVTVPIYVSEPESIADIAVAEQPVVARGALLGAVGTMTLAMILAFALFAVAIAWSVTATAGLGQASPPIGLTPTAAADIDAGLPEPALSGGTHGRLVNALLYDPAIHTCFRVWRGHNRMSDTVDVAQIAVSHMGTIRRLDSYVFDNIPDSANLDQCLARAVRAAEPRLSIDDSDAGAVLITGNDLDDIGLDASHLSTAAANLPWPP